MPNYDTIYPTGYRLLHPDEVRLLEVGDILRKWGQDYTIAGFRVSAESSVTDYIILETPVAHYKVYPHPESGWWKDVYAKFPRRNKKGEE
jgi:hypothetical protein